MSWFFCCRVSEGWYPEMALKYSQKKEAIKRLKKFNLSNSLGGLSWKALRDGGRKSYRRGD
jgi:hypothetical protein